MSIRLQMALLLIALSTVFLGTTWMMHALVMAPAFTKLEQDAAHTDAERCVEAIRNDIENLSNLANDWGAWDDTWRYVQGQNPSFVETNLMDETFTNTSTEFLCVLDRNNDVVWADCFDPVASVHHDETELLALVKSPQNGLCRFENNDASVSGIVLTELGPMLIASRPVIPTNREGEIMGTLIVGRFLNEARQRSLSERTHLPLQIWPATSPDIPAQIRMRMNELLRDKSMKSPHLWTEPETIKAVRMMADISGDPAIVLNITVARDISVRGQAAATTAMLCSLTGALLMMLGTGFVLRRRVVEPLQTMATHATRVGIEDDLGARLNSERTDEIGILARSFDHMVAHLAEARRKTEESAHRAGMAEIASEVLHNVGNAVNTANCCAEVISDRLNHSRLSGLEKTASLLSEQAPNAAQFFSEDPRGPKLISYLVTLTAALQKEQVENLSELQRLQETIRHIRDAIASQQSHARKSDFRQRVDLRALLNETLLVNEALQKQCGITVTIKMPDLPLLELNRSRVAQVLVNLEKNALLSMQSVPRKDHELTLNVAILKPDMLQIEIRDTGTGFTPEIHERLFGQGFTTRKEGSGLGLHYCVNVIREMGGDITAYSDGPETGASFTITIPRAVPETKKRSATDTETPASEVVDETASSSSTFSSSHNEPVISGRFQEQYA
jgi:two-component system NtrC family sensor kinase